jgi:hypothetical protein
MEAKDVWVLDASALIQMKIAIALDRQWAAFKLLEQLAVDGELGMCRHVINEVKRYGHPDVPGVWATGMRSTLKLTLDPADDHVRTVMAAAPNLIEADSTGDEADPYVVAHALHLAGDGHNPTVVTNDFVDRMPVKTSIASACDHLDVKWCKLGPFLETLGVKHNIKTV